MYVFINFTTIIARDYFFNLSVLHFTVSVPVEDTRYIYLATFTNFAVGVTYISEMARCIL